MAIGFSNLGASANPDINDGTNGTSFANSSWTPPTDELIVVFVESRRSGGPDTPTISGNGLTWTQVGSTFDADGAGNGMSMFAAKASGSSAGVTTVDFGVNTQVHCVASFFRVTGADLSGTIAAIFPQGIKTGSGTGTTGTVTLSAAADSNNRPVVCFWHKFNQTTTERADWTELDDMSGSGQARGVETQYRDDAFEITASATWGNSVTWGGVAAEIKAAAGDQSVTTAAIASGASLFLPTVAHEVAGAHISSGLSLNAPTAAYQITATVIASTATLFAVTVVPGSVAVTGAHIASGVALNVPDVAYKADLAFLASTATQFAPTVVPDLAVTTAFLASGSTLFIPTVVADQAVTATFIASGAAVNVPTVTYQVDMAAIASGAALFVPQVIKDQPVTSATIASTVAIFVPTVSYQVDLAFIGSTVALFAVTVVPGPVTVISDHIASTTSLLAPEAAYVVATAFIASASTLNVPTVAYQVDTANIVSGAVLFGPTVTSGQQVTGAFIASGSVLNVPAAAYIVAAAFIATGSTLTAPSILSVEQEGFRFRNDDGSETTATWRQAQDVDDAIPKETPFRLRILVNASGDPPSSAYQLEFRKVGGPSWIKVDPII